MDEIDSSELLIGSFAFKAAILGPRLFMGFLYLFAGFYLWRSSNFKIHPFTLFAVELLSHAGMYLDLEFVMKEFKVPFYNLLQLNAPFKEFTWEQYYNYYILIRETQLTLFKIFFQSFLSTELCIYADLYWTLKNPFYPRDQRVKWYYLFILASIVTNMLYNEFIAPVGTEVVFRGISTYYSVVVPLYFVLISFFLLRTISRLRVQGTSL